MLLSILLTASETGLLRTSLVNVVMILPSTYTVFQHSSLVLMISPRFADLLVMLELSELRIYRNHLAVGLVILYRPGNYLRLRFLFLIIDKTRNGSIMNWRDPQSYPYSSIT